MIFSVIPVGSVVDLTYFQLRRLGERELQKWFEKWQQERYCQFFEKVFYKSGGSHAEKFLTESKSTCLS